jgi:hypothetical protein
MDIKELQAEFKSAWTGIKSLIDQQADEMRTQSEALNHLAQAQAEHDEVLKTLIDKLN